MTEVEYREKMKELGWNDEEIDEDIKMYHLALELGITNFSLEDHLSPRCVVTSYPSSVPITEFKKEKT